MPRMSNSNLTWLVENLRISAFGNSHLDIDIEELWGKLFDFAHEKHQIERVRKQHLIEGLDGKNRRVVLIKNPDVIQLEIHPSPHSEDFPHIGPWKEQKDEIKNIATKLVKELPAFKRLAFGAVLNNQVTDRKTGYAILDKLLPGVEIDDACTDLAFQVNRPRSSRIDELKINRLCSWAVAEYRAVQMQVLPIVSEGKVQILFSAIRLTMDINSSAEYKKSFQKPEDKESLVDEFIDLADEISEKGDCK